MLGGVEINKPLNNLFGERTISQLDWLFTAGEGLDNLALGRRVLGPSLPFFPVPVVDFSPDIGSDKLKAVLVANFFGTMIGLLFPKLAQRNLCFVLPRRFAPIR